MENQYRSLLKSIAVLVILAIFSISVFAVTMSVIASLHGEAQTVVSSEQTQKAAEAFSTIDEMGSLFADALYTQTVTDGLEKKR